MPDRTNLRKIILETRQIWDSNLSRESVRHNFRKVSDCKTAALGAEVFESETEQKIFFHTCKSKACSSCGRRATQLWQRQIWAALPEIPYAGLVFTMPDVLWPIFELDRSFLTDLPILAAEAIKQYLAHHHKMRVITMIVVHTFGRRLNFHPHLHILVSQVGYSASTATWDGPVIFAKRDIMPLWRDTLMTFLCVASQKGLLPKNWSESEPGTILELQRSRWWNIDVANSKRSRISFAMPAGT
jgi:hypothetical protein